MQSNGVAVNIAAKTPDAEVSLYYELLFTEFISFHV